ncbi:hypothetical protein [Mucilaginibacter aquatilis]|uniref:Uncharacterized protein n=1 Tax=Mucilaginibacter aquatilis TaxID=1517760 RepID=A0A6I4IHW2_9SPHI|nr:hypothetical protein [Mucilaginibacter aquatilis]MVN92939.1 hypothetical protein [Mucilaginibacter aquatilis]
METLNSGSIFTWLIHLYNNIFNENITQQIHQAINTNVAWRVSELYLFIELAAQKNIIVSFEEDVENWAGICLSNTLIGYVWCKSPLLFITSQVAKLFESILDKCSYITYIEVSSIVSNELLIDYNPELIDRLGPNLYNKPVSVNDIWFDSIT